MLVYRCVPFFRNSREASALNALAIFIRFYYIYLSSAKKNPAIYLCVFCVLKALNSSETSLSSNESVSKLKQFPQQHTHTRVNCFNKRQECFYLFCYIIVFISTGRKHLEGVTLVLCMCVWLCFVFSFAELPCPQTLRYPAQGTSPCRATQR